MTNRNNCANCAHVHFGRCQERGCNCRVFVRPTRRKLDREKVRQVLGDVWERIKRAGVRTI